MAMNYKEAPQGASQAELAKYAKGIELVRNFVDSLAEQELLPERFETQEKPSLQEVHVFNAEHVAEKQKQVWQEFLGREIEVPPVPQELVDVYSSAAEKGINIFEPYFLPAIELKKNSRYPGWKIKPEAWYWDGIKDRRISSDAAKLSGNWVLVDTTAKPNYQNGNQEYPNDPLAQTLATLREEGKIKAVDYVPQTSRFAVSADELSGVVNPQIAELLGVKNEQVRQPKEIEFNIIGNISHSEWGQTNTWEWMNDSFGADDRLVGGGSDLGGLANVGGDWAGARRGGVGFRFLVEFPSKS